MFFMSKIEKTEVYEKYVNWVDRVTAFLAETGPKLGENGTHCCTFQSKPVLDKQPDVVFLGYNPHESGAFSQDDIIQKRFFEGNPAFYSPERKKWKVWKLEGAFEWAEYPQPITDGNFVFFNAVYFGSNDIDSFKRIPGSNEAIDKCLDFTKEVIQEIFEPKCVVGFSIPECFDMLNKKFQFSKVESIDTAKATDSMLIEFAKNKKNGAWKNTYSCCQSLKKGLWNEIPIYGIPHPSYSRLSNDDYGAIALYLRSEMQKLL